MATTLEDRRADVTANGPARLTPDERRASRPRSRRLGRRGHQALLVSHVLTSVGWFGVAITVAFCGIVGQSRGDVAFYEVIDATLALSIPLGLGAVVTGAALSLTTRWGLARHWWVVAKELGAVAVIATDVLVVGPTMQRAIDSGAAGEIPGPVYAHCVVLALATILSVVKPKARTPWSPATPGQAVGRSHQRRPASATGGGTVWPPSNSWNSTS